MKQYGLTILFISTLILSGFLGAFQVGEASQCCCPENKLVISSAGNDHSCCASQNDNQYSQQFNCKCNLKQANDTTEQEIALLKLEEKQVFDFNHGQTLLVEFLWHHDPVALYRHVIPDKQQTYLKQQRLLI